MRRHRPLIETDIEGEACEYARTLHLQHRKLAWVGRRGAPDRLFWGEGIVPFMIEFKKPGEKVVPGSPQDKDIRSLRAAGLAVGICDNLEDAKHFIRTQIDQAVKRALPE